MASVNLDIAQRLDITCRKRDTFSLTLNFTDSSGTAINLNSYDFKLDVRDATNNSDVIADTVFDYAGNSSGELVVSATSAEMDVNSGVYIYDLQTTLSGTVTTWLYGTFTINDDVTS